jgi:hypothetical protein
MTLPGLAEHAGQEGWSAHGKVRRLDLAVQLSC